MLMANKYQELSTHLISVASVSKKVIEKLNIKEDSFINKKKISLLAYYSGLLHDLGKIDPIFQKYLTDKSTTNFNPNGVHIEKTKFTFETHARHNEISWFLIEELFNRKDFKMNKVEYEILKNVILWHHASPNRKSVFNSSNIASSLSANKELLISNLKIILNKIDVDLDDEDLEYLFSSVSKDLTNYKTFFKNKGEQDLESVKQDIKNESIASLIRSVVTTADRHVSASGKNINEDRIINDIFEDNKYSELNDSILKMEETFFPKTERSQIQCSTAKQLSNVSNRGDVAILNAPAGSGKTKVSLQWAKENGVNRLYYIVPRTIIAEELYDEFKTTYLKSKVSFEIITGEKKIKWNGKKESILEDESQLYKSDIIITTIDQLIKTTTNHKNITILQDLICSHVIFDEYHEYYKMSGFDLLFAEFVKIKSSFENPKILLMSATPNFFMLEHFLEVSTISSSNIISFKTNNVKDYKLKYFLYEEESAIPVNESLFLKNENFNYKENKSLNIFEIDKNPFLKKWDDKKTIIISNTATMAQKSYLINYDKEDSLLAHSKFKAEDKINILKDIKYNFKQIDKGMNILRSGPIVQASLNITSERLITDLTTAEGILQRLGRLNRFGEDFIGEFIIAVPYQAFNEKIKLKSNVLSLLRSNNEKESSLFWLNFLLSKLNKKEDGESFKLDDMYEWYREFYTKKDISNIMNEELLSSLEKSYKNINKNILDPVDFIKNSKSNKKLSKNSLRGRSFNSQMAIYELKSGVLAVTDDYSKNIPLSKELLLLYNDNYMFVSDTVKKHEVLFKDLDNKTIRLLKQAKKQKSDKYNNFVLNASRNDNFSIFTSLSKKDLSVFNKSENNIESYIYIKTEKQNVGYLKIKQISK